MKKSLLYILICLMGLSVFPNFALAENAVQKEFYVSVLGDDLNDGTSKELAFKTIARAQEAIREINQNMNGNIVVNILPDGPHILEEPLYFHTEDSASNGYRIIYRGIKDEDGNRPVISGGTPITNFEPSEEYPGLWQAQVTDDDIYALPSIYVGNRHAFMAASERLIHPLGTYVSPFTEYESDGMYVSKADIGVYENPEDMIAYWDVQWKTSTVAIANIKEDIDDPDRMIVELAQPFWEQKDTDLASSLTGNARRPFWLLNAMELLDTPGEFYFNKKTRTVYYYPHEDEDMRTAEVYAPKQDKLIRMVGNDIDEKITGISFESLEFAHTAYNGWLEFFEAYQALLTRASNGVKNYAVGAVQLEFVDNCSFTDNVFFGLGECGISLENAVTNTKVVGNVFSDIGGAAVTVGDLHHQDYNDNDPNFAQGLNPQSFDICVGTDGVSDPPPSPAPSDLNLLDGYSRAWASTNGSLSSLLGNYCYFDESQLSSYYTWTDEISPNKGEKSWVKWDFEEPYSINKIRIYFNENEVSDTEKTNYEVLLSNDFLFREGNYTVVATQKTTPGTLAVYDREDDTKYRYMMIRTLGSNPLKFNGVWAHTKDRELFTRRERCTYLDVSNNYIVRADAYVHSYGVMHSFAMDDSKFEHNEIIGAPYSGIACGWGWRRCMTGAYRNSISFNYLKDITLTMDDGAPIYTMFHQPGSIVEGNYSEHVESGRGTYYFDEGSGLFTLLNNVSFDGSYAAFERYEIGKYCQGFNYKSPFYSDAGSTYQATEPDLESVQFIAADPIPKVKEIQDNAGLEPQYEYLRDLTDASTLRLASYYELGELALTDWNGLDVHKENLGTIFSNILANDAFGNLPGEYPPEYKFMIEEAAKKIKANTTYETITAARTLHREATAAFNRIPLNELIEKCETVLSGAEAGNKIGCYNETALAKFKRQVADAKAIAESNPTSTNEYETLRNLEKAYREFDATRASTDVEYVYVKDMVSCDIDKESGEITIVLPYGTDTSNPFEIGLVLSGDAISGINTSKAVIKDGGKLPIYSPTAKEYKIYNLNVCNESSEKGVWKLAKTTERTNMVETGEGLLLLPRNTAYTYSVPYTGGTEKTVKFSLNAKSGQTYDDVRFILNAKSSNININDTSSVNDRIEVVFDTDGAKLYEICGKQSKILDKSAAQLLISADNELTYKLEKINGQTKVTVKLNGKNILNGLATTSQIDGLTGILSGVSGIIVK